MSSLEKRIAKLEKLVEADQRRRDCDLCGPESLIMLLDHGDGLLRGGEGSEVWPVDPAGEVLCPRCGRQPVWPVIILRPAQPEAPRP